MHVVGTAGHVDHGKSTLVQALTGIDPDRFEEEKRRGLTIDLGFAWCTLPSGREIGIVDVPGHERFIRNMLAGVGGIDSAIFVVAADEGWMPQSAEHLQILDFLGVNKGVVAITKADIASHDDLDLVEEEVRAHLQDTPLTQAPIVRVSSIQRSGLDDLLAAIDESLGPEGEQTPSGRARLFVDRSFTIAGAGTVVTGTLTGGSLNVGDDVSIVPDGPHARIRSLQTHRASVTEAVPGSRVAANLVGLERHSVRRGDALVTDRWMLSERFAARLRAARGLDHTLSEQGAYELFVGSAQTVCRLKFLDREGDLGPAESTLIEAFCERPLPIVPGDRFVIRDVGRWQTVAGGAVIDQSPGRLRRGDYDAIRRLESREGLTGAELAEHVIRERRAIAFDELVTLTGIESGELDTAIDRAAGRYSAGFVISADHERGLESTARAALDDFHTSHPLDAGMPLDALCRALGIDRLIAVEIIGEWQRAGWIVRDGNVVRLVHRGSTLTPDQRSTADRALEALRAAGVSPPGLRELGVSVSLAKALERSGELVLVTNDIAYPADVWQYITKRIVDLLSSNGPATVSQLRGAIGTSRKFAVPLLEHTDATGVTRRKGDVRELGPRAEG